MSETPISPLCARMIEDMRVRKFGEAKQKHYIRHVKAFSTFLGGLPATQFMPLRPQKDSPK
jgi:integrase/recombinase XerD